MDLNSSHSNIVINSSDSDEESSENSIEIIGSEDEEEEDFSESCDSDSFLDGKIQIFMAQGAFFIWNAEDVQMLREECRIVGTLVGCLPRAPRQNNQLGLPLQLMPEEAKLLEEIEAACVVLEQDASDSISQMRKTTFATMREENYKAQQEMYKKSRKEEIWQHKHTIVEGKKAKKRKLEASESFEKEEDMKKVVADKTNSPSCAPAISGEDDTNSKSLQEMKDNSNTEKCSTDTDNGNSDLNIQKSEADIDKEADDTQTNKADELPREDNGQDAAACQDGQAKSANPDKSDDCVIIAADESDDEDDDGDFNVDDMVTTDTDIKHSLIQLFTENPWREAVKRPKHWIFPLSQKEFLRYEVFKDLWRKGYYLTSGSKFGGDYLVYPGDPARFHSHFIAVCVDKTIDLSALDIISLGRLGSNVRKTVLLCSFNKSKQIKYTSLQWTGIS